MTRDEFEKILTDAVLARQAGYRIVLCTDKIYVEKNTEDVCDIENFWKHGIDIRIFDTMGETHIFRGSIGDEFFVRMVSDETISEENYFDENQYLDIDTIRSDVSAHIAAATGGGRYPLPLEKYKDAQITIRNYLGYDDDTGRAFVEDWRIVGFKEVE